jgi:hypothetical protein
MRVIETFKQLQFQARQQLDYALFCGQLELLSSCLQSRILSASIIKQLSTFYLANVNRISVLKGFLLEIDYLSSVLQFSH